MTYRQPEENWIEIPFLPAGGRKDLGIRPRSSRSCGSAGPSGTPRCSICCSTSSGARSAGCSLEGEQRIRIPCDAAVSSITTTLTPPVGITSATGMQKHQSRCRQHPFIRAERLEDLVWREVRRVLLNPEVIVTGIDPLSVREDRGSAEELAKAERDLREVKREEERCIRLYVSGRITEDQLDHQRKFVTERLESLRARVEDYRAQRATDTERRALARRLIEWARRFGEGQRSGTLSSAERFCSFSLTAS